MQSRERGRRTQISSAPWTKKPPFGHEMKKSCSVATRGNPISQTASRAKGERAFVQVWTWTIVRPRGLFRSTPRTASTARELRMPVPNARMRFGSFDISSCPRQITSRFGTDRSSGATGPTQVRRVTLTDRDARPLAEARATEADPPFSTA